MIVFAPLPVAIERPEATAAVVTLSAPLTALAARSPCSPVTVNPAVPDKLKTTLSESAVASTLSVMPLESVMLVAPLPVVTFTKTSDWRRRLRQGQWCSRRSAAGTERR